MVEIEFNLYKPSGQWAYGGVCQITGDKPIWETDALLTEIAANQQSVIPEAILGRRYILVIHETREQAKKPGYAGFFCRLYPNRVSWG